MKRTAFFSLFFFGLTVVLFIVFIGKAESPSVPLTGPLSAPIAETKQTSLVFVGDIMFARGVRNSVYNNFGGNYDELFKNAEFIKNADIAFANLEGPVSDRGRNVGSIYSFRFEPKVTETLARAGFDIVSTANNHMGDWTADAFKDTLMHLKNSGILFAGGGMTKAEAETPAILMRNGIRFGFLGFTDVGPDWLEAKEYSAGILLASDPRFAGIIKNAKSEVDVLVVSIHWGEEYKPHTERQKELAHTAIDNGATLVIGHHPHVSQDTEYYKNGFIAYSLGNFIFDQYFSKETMEGMVLRAAFDKNNFVSAIVGTSKLNSKFQIETVVFPE